MDIRDTSSSPLPSVLSAREVRGLSAVRSQAASVRTLLDELERGTGSVSLDALSAQTVEELARLGCRCIELASVLSNVHSVPRCA